MTLYVDGSPHDLYTLPDEIDRDLVSALNYNDVHLAAPPVEVVVMLEGENEERPWYWVVKLADGSYAYVEGGCDYTGWDCSSDCSAWEERTLDEVLRHVPDHALFMLREMLASGEKVRPTP